MGRYAGRSTAWYGVVLLILLAAGLALPLLANTVTISNTPPSVTNRVAPNIVLTFDDSGSMNSTSIPDSMDANVSQPFYYSSSFNPLYYNPNITYVVPPPPPGGSMVTPGYGSAPRDGYCASLGSQSCWSPNQRTYLQPNLTDLGHAFYSGFLANIYAGNSPCARDANETSTWYNTNDGSCAPMNIPASVRGLVQTTSTSTSSSSSFCLISILLCPSPGTTVNGGTTTVVSSNCLIIIIGCSITTTVTTTSTVSVPDPGGFYYVCSTQTQCSYHSMSQESAAAQANFAIWYSYYRTRNLMARAAVGRVFAALADGSVRVAWQTLQSQAGSGNYYTGLSAYQGLSYGPLSLLSASTAAPSEILPLANSLTGCSPGTINSDSCWRSMLMNWIYGVPASGGTPTRVALQTVNTFYKQTLSATGNASRGAAPFWNDSTSSPTELSCRKNFSMLVTDGFWNNDTPATPSPKDTDSFTLPDGTVYAPTQEVSDVYANDGASMPNSLANIAFSGWAGDLRPDLTDNVPAYYSDLTTGVTGPVSQINSSKPGSNREVYYNPANDPASWQHISQYMVTLGAAGSLTNNAATLLALRTGQQAWPAPNIAGGNTNIDDTWHAALNSRGGYFSASDPTTLYNSLSTILASVIASSASSLNVSLSAQSLNTGTAVFAAGYNTSAWSGTLAAEAVDNTGVIGATQWEAGALLTKRDLVADPRTLVTTTGPGTGTGVPFSWTSLSTNEQSLLNSPDGSGSSSDGNGQARLAWLSGVRSQEGSLLRSRTSLLGPIFNSQPAYVAAPASALSDAFPAGSPEALASAAGQSYAAFVAQYGSRRPMVYVGANDGLLHAFDAASGRELWGFVPNSVYPHLSTQSKLSSYAYTPTVDGSPIQADVFFSRPGQPAGWHTILVGGLRFGGRGVYAIDITNPAAMTTSSAVAGKVLWEFNSSSIGNSAGNPANLGYTFGTPSVARLANGQWAVLVPGGYFPDGSTASAATNTFSSLFVLNAQTGALIKEIRTPAGVTSYGLSSLALGDYNADQIADVGFAGDLAGNIWRFDLSLSNLQSTDPTAGVIQLFSPAAIGAQSITTQPRLVADPSSNRFMVIFGTGRFLSPADTADTTVQSIYGIRDPGPTKGSNYPLTVASLVAQSLALSASGVIGVSQVPVPPTAGGWYLPLQLVPGERVVVNPYLQASTDAVVFTTLIPASNDPCTTALGGSILALDATTGTAALGNNFGNVGLPAGFVAAGSKISQVASGGSLNGAVGAGGAVYFPGTSHVGTGNGTVSIGGTTRRRRSWRILDNYEN